MKYIVVLCDGMSGYPVESLGGKTTMEAAKKINMDKMAEASVMGMVKTVPDGMPPGSDVANLSAMGFNPLKCYTGRSPLEAVSIGIRMEQEDIAFRCNLVTLTSEADYSEKVMADYSAQEITTEEARELINTLSDHFKNNADLQFYPGISYRHCMIWNNGPKDLGLVPPHDISDKKVGEHLPKVERLRKIMEESYAVLKDHEVNKKRIEKGLNPANSLWIWGEGTKPKIPDFYETFGIKGAVISAVDLVKGIGISAGMQVIDVEGATGNINTNFDNKCKAAYEALKDGNDYVYLHIEAPDECGHRGEAENKVKSIEFIDEKVVGPLIEKLNSDKEEFKMLIMPDHPTPIAIKTHTSEKVPFMIFQSTKANKGVERFSEKNALSTGIYFESGEKLMDFFIKN